MVDIAFLTEIASLLGYFTVSIAALGFVFNIIETTKNRRITLQNTLMNSVHTEEGQRKIYELMSQEWRDFEDFRNKYDSAVNSENYIKRVTMWKIFDYVGWHYKKGLVDLETIYYAAGQQILLLWIKYGPIIEEYRKIQYGGSQWENWEFLANALYKMSLTKDPEIAKNWDPIIREAFTDKSEPIKSPR